MQLLTLKIFCDLVELGSFSDAAKKNGITQSAVSQQISALEDRHGVSFFERGKKKFSVTPEGRIFEQAAREMLEIYNSIDTRINGLTDKVSGNLHVSTVYSIGLHVLPPMLKVFRAVHPEVTVKVDYKRSPRVYEDVLAGRVDLGLVSFPRTGSGINADVFDEDEMVVVCAPGHKLAKKKKMKLKDLQGESFVAYGPDTPTSKAIDHALRENHVAFGQEHEFDDIETVKRAVEVAGVVSIVPRRTVEKEVKEGRLCAINVEGVDLKRPLGIIRKQGKVTSPALREFMRILQGRK